jgi:hypothetical protein
VSKVLIVANESVEGPALLDALRRIGDHAASDYFVMVPAHPLEDVEARGLSAIATPWNQEGAIGEAQKRLAETLDILKEEGLTASGEVGDPVPARAVDDALLIFDADVIVIASLDTDDESGFLRKGLIDKVRSAHPDAEVIHISSEGSPAGPGPSDSLEPHTPTERAGEAPLSDPAAPDEAVTLPADSTGDTA